MIEIISVSDIACANAKHQNKKNGLRSCPHCGGDAVIIIRPNGMFIEQDRLDIWCECKDCHARTKAFVPEMGNPEKAMESIELAKAHAIDAWNMRS